MVLAIDEVLYCEFVTFKAETCDAAYGFGGGVGGLPEFFAGVDVGDVHFNYGYADRCDGVCQCNAGVGVTASIQNDTIYIAPAVV